MSSAKKPPLDTIVLGKKKKSTSHRKEDQQIHSALDEFVGVTGEIPLVISLNHGNLRGQQSRENCLMEEIIDYFAKYVYTEKDAQRLAAIIVSYLCEQGWIFVNERDRGDLASHESAVECIAKELSANLIKEKNRADQLETLFKLNKARQRDEKETLQGAVGVITVPSLEQTRRDMKDPTYQAMKIYVKTKGEAQPPMPLLPFQVQRSHVPPAYHQRTYTAPSTHIENVPTADDYRRFADALENDSSDDKGSDVASTMAVDESMSIEDSSIPAPPAAARRNTSGMSAESMRSLSMNRLRSMRSFDTLFSMQTSIDSIQTRLSGMELSGGDISG